MPNTEVIRQVRLNAHRRPMMSTNKPQVKLGDISWKAKVFGDSGLTLQLSDRSRMLQKLYQ